MAIRVALHHVTHYKYDRPIHLGAQTIRLRPAPHSRTPIEAYSLKISPENHFVNWQQDPFGNFLARVVFPPEIKITEFKIDVEVIARLESINPFDFFLEDYAEEFPFSYDAQLQKELLPYLEKVETGPLFHDWIENIDVTRKYRTVDFLVLVNQKLNQSIAYTVRLESGIQTCEQTLQLALGSCRDTGWLLVQIFRHFGLAARFVSGYSVQLTADIKSLDGPSGVAQDVTDLHAWCEVYIPGAGWIALDPTSGMLAGEGHIPLCCTPDPASASPITGTLEFCETEFLYSNEVIRITEDPRVTKPYSDTQWMDILHLGDQIDVSLAEGDVRLTMGGEPTFVSIDDFEGDEWNTTADSPQKQKLALDFSKRILATFSKGGMLHYGMGKWYPGEPLPRWANTVFWRKDGIPVWKDISLLADKDQEDNIPEEMSEKFLYQLSKYLDVPKTCIDAAYEDAFYFVWKEGKIPVNVDPLKFNLKDSIERQTLAQLLQKDLSKPKGWFLPLVWNFASQSWRSTAWKFRTTHCFLIPGNSPIGLRLPLESIPQNIKPEEKEQIDRSLFEDLPALSKEFGRNRPKIKDQEGEDKPIGTSLCAEVRDGHLYLFMPPLDYLEHYLDLLSCIEQTASDLKVRVFIEGYEPPKDYRIDKIVVTPDPGVIEVNINPSTSWRELVQKSEVLYEQARLSRLGTEKFMQDGRHTGTGGGNHITVGGSTPADSPMLRRPDLLRSLITYWQHHPSLSYLFSGAFVGPTSQAPRVDEGRDDRLYELDIAFSQIPDEGTTVPYWLVDRLLRHLLTDLTGNTHRAEFCIDKLYSPDSSTGRLGILEFRGFEMPPHERMSLVQQLLIRGLIAMFWKKPYKQKLLRWGTELHDKFMLAHYARLDINHVIQDLNDFGFAFDPAWLDPFFEFRFPRYGTVQFQDIDIELRMGIEPWHVLGEEQGSGGTARYVDSSLERIQIKINGIQEKRYALLCNGKRMPLKSTGIKEEYICGIRYKAWNPPSALHPTIGVQSPLIFDVIDLWNNKSVAGCKYFVSHPGGRSYDTYPINAFEAESRRINRFADFGHTSGAYEFGKYPVHTASGPVYSDDNAGSVGRFEEGGSGVAVYVQVPPEPMVNEEYPYTLDLRR